LVPYKRGKESTSSKPILQLDLTGKFIKKFWSTREAERETGILNQNISKVLTGKRKSAGNFKWEFEMD
jgi:hypothetical protein